MENKKKAHGFYVLRGQRRLSRIQEKSKKSGKILGKSMNIIFLKNEEESLF